MDRVARRLCISMALSSCGGVVACGDASSRGGDAELVEATFAGSPSPGVVALANRWRFAGGATVSAARVSPVPVRDNFRVGFDVAGAEGCEVQVFAWPPRRAAETHVWRGRPTPLAADGRGVDQVVAVDADRRLEVALTLPRPWHPSAVTVELELRCGGALTPVIDGPRRERRLGDERLPGARAVLGVFDVHRRPTQVRAHRGTPRLDGLLDEPVWADAERHPLVNSIDGEPLGIQARSSEVRLAWDDDALYVGAQLRDRDVWSEFQRRDDPLWEQEVFEVFVARDAGEPYLELQVSPAGVMFDARFAAYRDGDPAWDGTWRRAVRVDGTLNDEGDVDRGWSVEVAIPWAELCAQTDVPCPVAPGDRLRLNAFRFERIDRKRAEGTALSPTLTTDFHAWANAAVVELGS